VMPKTVVAGGDQLRVRLVGKKKFKRGSTALVNGVPAMTQFQSGDLLVTLTADQLAQPGTAMITVKTGDAVSAPAVLTLIAAQGVSISAISPRVIVEQVASGSFQVVVQGSNFDSKSVIRAGGVKINTMVVRKGDLSLVKGFVDANEIAVRGSFPLQVQTGDG